MKTEFYPISLPAIAMKVASKNGRKKSIKMKVNLFYLELYTCQP